MCNLFKNSIILLLVILKLYIRTSSTLTICDMQITCGLRNETKITKIPSECTAVAVAGEDISNINVLRNSINFYCTKSNAIHTTIIDKTLTNLFVNDFCFIEDLYQVLAVENFKGSLPLLIISHFIDFETIGTILEQNFEDVFGTFVNIKFDFMVFDETYKFLHMPGSSNTEYSQQLSTFFDKTKELFPEKLFGLLVGHDVKSNAEKIDLKMLNEHVDFFLIESTGYRDCDYHIHQKDMNVLAKKEDLLESFKHLNESGVPLNKLIYTIELTIESIKVTETEDMDYSYLCSNTLSDDRKYCFNTIQCLFEKARLHISEGTAGIYINGIENDDVTGLCGCKTLSDQNPNFRGLKTIAGASQENANNLSFYDCHEGLFPLIESK